MSKRRNRRHNGGMIPVARPMPQKSMVISDQVVSQARALGAQEAVPVFTAPIHPPGVGPSTGAAMAFDEDITSAQTWANAAALNGVWTEGVTFLGYAYLSELAQRPEYRMMSETIASEMTRKWITFTSSDDEDDSKAERIKELEAEFKRLNVRDMFCRATEQDGFFGRGHIYIDTGDTDSPDELKTSIGDGWDTLSKVKLKRKPIKSLRTVEAVWCYPTSYNSNDPLKDDWYRPNEWYVQAKIVHSSRLITLIGREVPDLLKPTYSFGGLSLSQMAKPYVDNWLRTRQSVSDIISAFTVFVLASNLQETVQGDGQLLFRRAELFNSLRDNRGLMIIDKESELFQNVSASLAGLHELQAQSQEHMSSISHIPTVKLLGIQPAGLNADSEGVMRSFYDYVHSFQEHLYRNPLRRLMGLVMVSLWGETDDTIDFKFETLWALDEKGEAEVEKLKAETDQILVDVGALSPEEVRKRVASDPNSDHSSLDVDDLPDLMDEEENGLEPDGDRVTDGLFGREAAMDEFNPNQPRNPDGEWDASGGGGSSGSGAAPLKKAKLPPEPKSQDKTEENIKDLSEIMGLIEEHGTIYARWSIGPEFDMKPGAKSRDYQSGELHEGLSANPISGDETTGQVVKRLGEYGYMRGSKNPAKLHLYAGKENGTDSDGTPTIVPTKYLGTVNKKMTKLLDDDEFYEAQNAIGEYSRTHKVLAAHKKDAAAGKLGFGVSIPVWEKYAEKATREKERALTALREKSPWAEKMLIE